MTRLPGRYDNRYLGLPNHVSSIGWMRSFCSSQKAKEDDPERETEKERKTERQKEKERESRQPMTRLGSRYDIGT